MNRLLFGSECAEGLTDDGFPRLARHRAECVSSLMSALDRDLEKRLGLVRRKLEVTLNHVPSLAAILDRRLFLKRKGHPPREHMPLTENLLSEGVQLHQFVLEEHAVVERQLLLRRGQARERDCPLVLIE